MLFCKELDFPAARNSQNFIVTTKRPLGRVAYDPCANHLEIDIEEALNQVAACFHSRRMITIFPVCPLPILPLIEFLSRPSCHQLNGVRNDLPPTLVSDKKVDGVGGHHRVEQAQTEALLGFEKPLQISMRSQAN